jgi:hypothetical protein
MNVFFLNYDAQKCAEMHIDKHVTKMCIEYPQLMSTAHRFLDGEEYTELSANGRRIKRWRLSDVRENHLMLASHINHPSAIWVRDNVHNYMWLYQMWLYLLEEYRYRYGKNHACSRLIPYLAIRPHKIAIDRKFFPPTPAMPTELKVLAENPIPGRKYDSLKSYHNYYNVSKRSFASWRGKINSRPIPEWYNV